MTKHTWHIIEGAEGCAFALKHGCVAVVVDALRASATAAMLLDAGARELLVVQEIEDAWALKRAYPEALLFGERGGLPPSGFDCGNSPRDVSRAAGRTVIFTTTTGAGRLVACRDAPASFMGTTVNASAVARAAVAQDRDVVLIPAGLMSDPKFDPQEDWVAAAAIAARAGARIGEGAQLYHHWRGRIEEQGIARLFATAPHAEKLRRVSLGEDIAFCARVDATSAVPWAVLPSKEPSIDVPHVRCVDYARS